MDGSLKFQAVELIADLNKKNPEDIALLFNGKKLNEEKVTDIIIISLF
jgi:hypothetical protein